MRHKHSVDAIVVGGGIIGLTSALSLADAGYRVTLLEAQTCGQEASWAGGGILSPLYPWRYPDALMTLLRSSLDSTQQLSHRSIDAVNIDPEINRCGMWIKSLPESEANQAQMWIKNMGWPYELVRRLNGLFDLWLPTCSNVRNPRLLKALVALLKHHPRVQIVEQQPVLSFKNQRAAGHSDWLLTTEQGRYEAPLVVCAAGAWSSELLKKSAMELVRVRPALGQMLLLYDSDYRHQPMLLQNGRYLVPRKDGHLLVGSTVSYVGFRKVLSHSSYQSLIEFAQASLGEKVKRQVRAYWAGLRPDAGCSLPLIGEHPRYPGVWMNTGHFRNGLVLAQGAANYLLKLIEVNDGGLQGNPFALPTIDKPLEYNV